MNKKTKHRIYTMKPKHIFVIISHENSISNKNITDYRDVHTIAFS